MNIFCKSAGPKFSEILLATLLSLFFLYGQEPKGKIPESLFEQYSQALQAGESRWREGNYQESFIMLNAALGFAQRMKDIESEAHCLMLLGRLCWAIERFDDSKKYYSDTLFFAKDFKLIKETEKSLLALKIWELYTQGKADCFAGQYEKSIVNFNSAIEFAKKLESKEHEVKCLRQLSLTYLVKQDLENYLYVNKRILQIAQSLNDQREQIKSLNNIGYYYLKFSDYSKALNYYSEALDRSRNIMNKENESVCLKNISLVMTGLGFFERSLDYLMAAHHIDRQLGNTDFFPQNLNDLGEGFRNRGILFSDNSDLYQALDFFKEALDLAKINGDEKTELKALNNIGNTHLHLEKYHTAQSCFRSAFQIAENIQDNEALIEISTNMGICSLKMGNCDKAQAHFRKALEYGAPMGADRILWKPLFYLGQCYEKKQANDQALACYKQSMDAIDYIRSQILFDYYKVEFGKNKFKVYESAINLLYRLYQGSASACKAEEIFYSVEKAKARAFLETLGELKKDFGSRLNPALGKKEREISSHVSSLIKEMSQRDLSQRRLGELKKALRQFEDEYLMLISRMRAEMPEVADFISPLPIQMKQVQEGLLDDKTAILEYFLGEKNSLLFFITKKEFIIFPLPSRNEIEKSIKAYIALLSNPPKGKWKGALAAKRLSQELLFFATQRLPESIDRLIVIPDGSLFYLPFETLPLLNRDPSSGQDFLISKYVVSYGSSCSSLLVLKEIKKRDRYLKGLLAFGNPSYRSNASPQRKNQIMIANIMKEVYEDQGFDLSSLGQSGQEIKRVSRFFSENNRAVFMNKEASEENIKRIALEDYQIVHFACHGFLDEKIPIRSSLVLSSNEETEEDGFLQVREIANLRLAAELVVLSACQTNRGYIEKGEGILGLTRIFFFSGARSVVSTLWEIRDDVTAKFMDHFYNYLSKKKDKAQALRLAKLCMLESKYSHPFYWAALVLHGEPSTTLGVY